VDSEAQAATTTEAAASTTTAAQSQVEYKSDALDELLGDSLFKRKKSAQAPTEDTLVDQVLSAQVDMKALNLADTSQEATETPADATNVQTG